MGILDDAIREHLDLKRLHGAEDTELARLEGEAFGPPSRPDDPDFPEQGEPEGQTAVATDDALAQLETGQLEAAPPSGEAPALEAPPAATEPDAPAEPAPTPSPAAAEPEAPVIPEPEPPAAAEPEAPGAGSTSLEGEFYDQEGELDLDLELDEELPPEAKAPPEPQAPPEETVVHELLPEESSSVDETADEPAIDPAPAPPPVAEPPIESLDTVEHHFEDAVQDTADAEAVEAEVVDGEIVEEDLTGDNEPVDDQQDDEDSEDEDVLEETPEFLRDQPEDDELWFEQGEPKDFDF